jgi:hypothetical protein
MDFGNYNAMLKAEINGDSVGKWKGMQVFISSVDRLSDKGSGVYYILYDDENRLVRKCGNEWRAYGTISNDGCVEEYASVRKYTVAAHVATEPTAAADYTPGYDMEDRPTGDVKVEIDVEATLKKAREMTVESLLEGFTCGL